MRGLPCVPAVTAVPAMSAVPPVVDVVMRGGLADDRHIAAAQAALRRPPEQTNEAEKSGNCYGTPDDR
jgi:hypothetical protein